MTRFTGMNQSHDGTRSRLFLGDGPDDVVIEGGHEVAHLYAHNYAVECTKADAQVVADMPREGYPAEETLALLNPIPIPPPGTPQRYF